MKTYWCKNVHGPVEAVGATCSGCGHSVGDDHIKLDAIKVQNFQDYMREIRSQAVIDNHEAEIAED